MTPALQAWLAGLGERREFAQVLVRREPNGFELRHAADANRPAGELRLVSLSDLRPLAQTTVEGTFRPLRTAPNLARGWRINVASPTDLEAALNTLYPGALADWFAFQTGSVAATEFRAFATRQTGLFARIAQLSDDQAARLTRACCDRSVCLRRRLWAVGRAGPDEADEKSLIPCFEPCALWLEFARQVANLLAGTPAAAKDRSVIAGLEALPAGVPSVAEADFSDAWNPRWHLWHALARSG